MSFWKIYWISSTTVRNIHQGRNMSCNPSHGPAPVDMTWQDQISCWGNMKCSSPCPQLTGDCFVPQLTVVTQNVIPEFQPYSELLEQPTAGRNTDLQHHRWYTQLAPGSNKLASCDLVGIGRCKTGMPLTLFFLCKKNSFTQGWGSVCF